MSRHPTVKWAQRSDKLYLTIEVPDAKDVKLKVESNGKFFFSAMSGADKMPYEVDMDLFDNVDMKEIKARIGSRNICYVIPKAEKKWWSRLLKQERKPPVFLKVDWDKWVDEDDEDGRQLDTEMDFGDIDYSNLIMEDMNDFFDVDGADKFEEDENALYAQVVPEVKAEKNTKGGLSEINCNCDCSKCINCVKRVARTSYMQEIPEAPEQGITISEANLRNFRPDFYFMKETLSMEHNKNWILSTAIARHVCCNKEWFADYKESEGSVMVNAFGISMPILGTGTIHLLTEQGIVVTLHNVRHVPDGDNNAISVSSLTSFGFHVTMAAGCMEAFRPDSTSILYAPRGEVLWYVSCTTLVPMEMDPNTKEIYLRFKNDKVTTRSEMVLSGGGQQPGGRQQSGGGQQRKKKGGQRQQHN